MLLLRAAAAAWATFGVGRSAAGMRSQRRHAGGGPRMSTARRPTEAPGEVELAGLPLPGLPLPRARLWCAGNWSDSLRLVRGQAFAIGTFGDIWEVTRNDTDEQMALKVFKDSVSAERELSAETLVRSRAGRGGLFANTLPVAVFDSPPSLLLPLHRGGVLRPRREAKEVMAQLALGLWELHRRKIIHRDFKLDNVMGRDEGQLHWAIVDYGLAKVCSRTDRVCIGHRSAGTKGFEAPSVSADADARELGGYGYEVDWYSWGVSLFYMLFGEVAQPFGKHGSSEAHLAGHRRAALLRGQILQVQRQYGLRVPTAVVDLLDMLLGPRFEGELSKYPAREAMQLGNPMRHPVLGHGAWLLETWTLSEPHCSASDGLAAFWVCICFEHAADDVDCAAMFFGNVTSDSPAETLDLCPFSPAVGVHRAPLPDSN